MDYDFSYPIMSSLRYLFWLLHMLLVAMEWSHLLLREVVGSENGPFCCCLEVIGSAQHIFVRVTLTLTFDLWPRHSNSSKRATKHVFHVNLVQILSLVPEIFDSQAKERRTKKSQTVLKTEPHTQFTACCNDSTCWSVVNVMCCFKWRVFCAGRDAFRVAASSSPDRSAPGLWVLLYCELFNTWPSNLT